MGDPVVFAIFSQKGAEAFSRKSTRVMRKWAPSHQHKFVFKNCASGKSCEGFAANLRKEAWGFVAGFAFGFARGVCAAAAKNHCFAGVTMGSLGARF